MLAPETVEEQESCGRGFAVPPTVGHHPSADLHVLVPDTPVPNVGGLEGHVSGTLAVPDTQDSLPSSCVQIREESKEEEDLFSTQEATVDIAPHCSFSLQLSSSQMSAVPAESQQDPEQHGPGESAMREASSSSSSSSAGGHRSSRQPSSSGSSSDGAGVGGAGGGGAGAEGQGGGGWTTSADSDDTQELGGQNQRSSEHDSVVVLDSSSISVPLPADVRPSGEVPVGANEDVIVLGDSLTVEVQGASVTVREAAPPTEDYEGETLPYSATEEAEGKGSPASRVGGEGAGQPAVSSDSCSDPKSTPANPFQFTTTRSPSKRAEPGRQGEGTSEPREREDPGHPSCPEDVAMDVEHPAVASTEGRRGMFVLGGEGQGSHDSEFELPVVQVQSESQSQFQDAFLFQPSFRINSGFCFTSYL